MIRDIVGKILPGVSEAQMMDTVRLVSGFHRLQASEGYRDAARAVAARAEGYGIRARVDSYEAAYGVKFLTMGVFPEWNCRAAFCRLVAPEAWELADFAAEPLGVMQKSFPYDDGPLELVPMDRGSDPAAYAEVDLAGRLLFIREDFNAYLWAVRARGALGFLSDHVAESPGRSRADMMDVRKYTTFWWESPPDIEPFGFVITPRMGDRLAAICRAAAASGTRPMVDCRVDAAFTDGAFENVVLELPGESKEEVWLVAHLCHPRPSANDNASGVAAALEALRAVKRLTDEGALPPLKRGLKALLIPEFTGLYAHLSRMDGFGHVAAALNLDMVGGRQDLGYGPLTLSGLSHACPSVAFELARRVLDALRQETAGFSATSRVPRFNSATCGFTAGSDHFILQDPTIGIPAPMLGQWPDRFYHTSGDTPDVVSPRLLAKSAALAAGYGYILCTLDALQLEEILAHSAAHFAEELAEIGDGRGSIPRRLACGYIQSYYIACAESAARLVPGADAVIRRAKRRILRLGAAMAGEGKAAVPRSGDDRVPVRTYAAPVNQLSSHTGGDPAREKAVRDYNARFRSGHRDAFVAEILTQYHMDGVKTVGEIVRRVRMEAGGGSARAIARYIETMAALGLCKFRQELEGSACANTWKSARSPR